MVGPVAAAALVGLIAGAEFAVVVRSCIECEDTL